VGVRTHEKKIVAFFVVVFMREQRQIQCVRRDAYSTVGKENHSHNHSHLFCVCVGGCVSVRAWADPSMENENWERSNEKYSLYAFNEH
jgi:hypothetical protein